MKKIYFACSVRGGRADADIYAQILKIISKYATPLTEVLTDKRLTPRGSPGDVAEIYKKDLGWLKESSALIAEATNPSLGVGYEIAQAEQMGKPVLVLYRPQPDRRLSALIAGSPGSQVLVYDKVAELEPTIKAFIAELSN